jgi:hypothetical protein
LLLHYCTDDRTATAGTIREHSKGLVIPTGQGQGGGLTIPTGQGGLTIPSHQKGHGLPIPSHQEGHNATASQRICQLCNDAPATVSCAQCNMVIALTLIPASLTALFAAAASNASHPSCLNID